VVVVASEIAYEYGSVAVPPEAETYPAKYLPPFTTFAINPSTVKVLVPPDGHDVDIILENPLSVYVSGVLINVDKKLHTKFKS
jgi:hypothetical protein